MAANSPTTRKKWPSRPPKKGAVDDGVMHITEVVNANGGVVSSTVGRHVVAKAGKRDVFSFALDGSDGLGKEANGMPLEEKVSPGCRPKIVVLQRVVSVGFKA